MKAIVYEEYGPPQVLRLQNVDKPAPKDNEILVRNYAASVGFGDLLARHFKDVSPAQFTMPFPFWLMTKFYFGFSEPKVKILGAEFAGEVESVGSAVKQFIPGDQVFGYLGQGMGAYAEYLCMPEDGTVTSKPTNFNYAEAAVVPYGAIMALYLLREKGNIQSGSKVLINGASGSIGAAAVQITRSYGAHVTGVCGSPRIEFVKSLGADRVIDYSKQDFTQNGERYDLIFDVLGKTSASRCKNSLADNGRCLYASFKTGKLIQMLTTSIGGSKKVVCAIAPGSKEDLVSVKELMEAGKLKAFIDRSFPLEKAAEAHSYVESGQKKGHIAITIAHNEGNLERSIQ
jgi:NADPH:quinone reductase-like Zn-dependent oxidoreductase